MNSNAKYNERVQERNDEVRAIKKALTIIPTPLTLAPLVREQWWWFSISWFDPRWKQTSLVCLIPQVLVEVCVSDLLQRLHVVHWNQVTVQIHELNANLINDTTIQCYRHSKRK